jgi:hypothetical protein
MGHLRTVGVHGAWTNTGIGLAKNGVGERLSQTNIPPGSSSVLSRRIPARRWLSLAKLIIWVYIVSLVAAMITATALTGEEAPDGTGSTIEAGSTRTSP